MQQMPPGLTAPWRKSTRSQGPDGGCVAISRNPTVIGIADTKAQMKDVIRFSPQAFDKLLDAIADRS